jgi:hypothetical protein
MAKFVKNDFFMSMEEICLHSDCAEDLIFEAVACADIPWPDIVLFMEKVPDAQYRIRSFAFAYWRVKISRGEFK